MEQLALIREYKPRIYTGPTSMVSLIVPPGTNLGDLRQTMKREYQTASNIKSSTNRKSVQAAISSISEYLKGVKALPDTGIALYAEQFI